MIEHLVAHVVTFFVERRLDNDAATAADAHLGTWRLQHSAFFRGFWTVMAVFWALPVGLFVWLWVSAAFAWELAGGILLFGALLAASVLLAWDGWAQEVELSPVGIRELRRGTGMAEIPWGSVEAIRYASWIDSFVVRSRQGRRVRVSKHIHGLRQFRMFARTYAPATAIEGVRDRLKEPTRV
jgi:hypothetical protein